jgi:hypothetical protein
MNSPGHKFFACPRLPQEEDGRICLRYDLHGLQHFPQQRALANDFFAMVGGFALFLKRDIVLVQMFFQGSGLGTGFSEQTVMFQGDRKVLCKRLEHEDFMPGEPFGTVPAYEQKPYPAAQGEEWEHHQPEQSHLLEARPGKRTRQALLTTGKKDTTLGHRCLKKPFQCRGQSLRSRHREELLFLLEHDMPAGPCLLSQGHTTGATPQQRRDTRGNEPGNLMDLVDGHGHQQQRLQRRKGFVDRSFLILHDVLEHGLFLCVFRSATGC